VARFTGRKALSSFKRFHANLLLGSESSLSTMNDKYWLAAQAAGVVLTPAAVMAVVLSLWRIAAGLHWTSSFVVLTGPFSSWEAWLGVAALMKLCEFLVDRMALRPIQHRLGPGNRVSCAFDQRGVFTKLTEGKPQIMPLSQTTDPVSEIEVLREIRGLVLRVLGPLTAANAAVVRREILAAWDGRKGPEGMVLDLCDVGHLDRASVGMLLELVQKARAERIPFELTNLGTPLLTIS
jgi:anti-anti-sigma regulatory factor